MLRQARARAPFSSQRQLASSLVPLRPPIQLSCGSFNWPLHLRWCGSPLRNPIGCARVRRADQIKLVDAGGLRANPMSLLDQKGLIGFGPSEPVGCGKPADNC